MIEMSLQEFLLVHSLTLLNAGLFFMAKTYSRKLSSPKWQKKRLKVLERDKWVCKKCGDDETELHVHHLEYHKNPWDTPINRLITLCAHCHELIEGCKEEEDFKDFDFKDISIYKSNNWKNKNRIMYLRAGTILSMSIYDEHNIYIIGFNIPEWEFLQIKKLMGKTKPF